MRARECIIAAKKTMPKNAAEIGVDVESSWRGGGGWHHRSQRERESAEEDNARGFPMALWSRASERARHPPRVQASNEE